MTGATVTCKNCGFALDEDPSGISENRTPCPVCGSTLRNFNLYTEPGQITFSGALANLTVRRNFIGREKELELLNSLVGRRGYGISITGGAGVGKTALIEFFTSIKNEYFTEWLRADDSIDLFRKVDNFLLKIRSSNERKQYLVVIDEVDKYHVTELQDYLKKILNFKRVSALIFIGQRSLNIPHIYQIHLEPLSQADFLKWSQSNDGVIYTLEESQIVEATKPEIIVFNDALIEKLKKEPNGLYKISPRQFEEVVADLLSDMGWEVSLTKETRDGGKDILAYKDTGLNKILCLVEAKKYSKSNPVGIGLVRQLHSTLMHEKANMAMMVTTSRFSPDSHDFQKNYEYQLSLKEYTDVVSWLLNYKN
jgi:restriction system protein